jgi:hypothetical protein
MFAYLAGYTTRIATDAVTVSTLSTSIPLSGALTHLQHVGGLEYPSLFTLSRDQVGCHDNNPVDSALDLSERFPCRQRFRDGVAGRRSGQASAAAPSAVTYLRGLPRHQAARSLGCLRLAPTTFSFSRPTRTATISLSLQSTCKAGTCS